MNTSATNLEILVTGFRTEGGKGIATFAHGVEVVFPLAWFPDLEQASKKQLAHWELIGRGEGLHWPDLDADISAEGILFGRKAYNYRPFESPLTPEGLKTIRTEQLKLSQRTLGELTGFSEAAIRHFESGRRQIPKRFEIALAQLI